MYLNESTQVLYFDILQTSFSFVFISTKSPNAQLVMDQSPLVMFFFFFL